MPMFERLRLAVNVYVRTLMYFSKRLRSNVNVYVQTWGSTYKRGGLFLNENTVMDAGPGTGSDMTTSTTMGMAMDETTATGTAMGTATAHR